MATVAVLNTDAHLSGQTILLAATAATVSAAWTHSADLTLTDNTNLSLGTGGDADLTYNGTDVVLSPAVVGTGDFHVSGASIEFDDSEGVTLGTGKDATLQYDGTDVILDPAVVGTGRFLVNGANGATAVELASGASAMELRLREPSGGGSSYTGFKSPALAGNLIYTLPTTDGAASSFLQTDGSLGLTWAAAGTFAGLSPLTTRGDTLVASSGVVTGTRLAIGAANTVLTSDGTDAAWAAPGGATVGYTATLADVANTATETTMISFTVPANKMADGDMIQIWFHGLLKNNKGTAGTVTLSVDWGATSSANFTAVNQNDNAAEREFIKSVVMIRSGTDLIFTDQSAADKGPYVLFGYGSWTYADFTVKATSVDFTVNSTVAVRVALSAAHATFYIKPQTASVIKYEGDA